LTLLITLVELIVNVFSDSVAGSGPLAVFGVTSNSRSNLPSDTESFFARLTYFRRRISPESGASGSTDVEFFLLTDGVMPTSFPLTVKVDKDVKKAADNVDVDADCNDVADTVADTDDT